MNTFKTLLDLKYKKNIKMYTFVVCGVFKNEGHILHEWIRHYLYHGVDHIFLVNDNSTDNYLKIIEEYSDRVTLFNNDIETHSVDRQSLINEKYFTPLFPLSKWMAILDLDEFLYSPKDINLCNILNKYESYSQILVEWLMFGSNDNVYQPHSVCEGFRKRAIMSSAFINSESHSYKPIFKCSNVQKLDIHVHKVFGDQIHLTYYENETKPDFFINHYNVQSLNFFTQIKGTRGDINNWYPSIGRTRDIQTFYKYDFNEIEDNVLFEQNKDMIYDISMSKIIEGDEVTLVITSCNRPHLLEKTLESFIKYNTFPIKCAFIVDDSGFINCNTIVVNKFNKFPIHQVYNKKNIGQIQSIDKVYSYVTTPYIFHCEEDWEFIRSGFIEKSMSIFKSLPDEKIYTVWLRPHNETSGHPIIFDNENKGYYIMKKDFSYVDKGQTYTWGGITFNPGLRRTCVCMLYHPYSLVCDPLIFNNKKYIGEYSVNKKYTENGYYSCILDHKDGYVKHIGGGEHIPREWD